MLPLIQWYPGHIAKAEKELKEQIKRVDVILEVLDARIPLTSSHPLIQQWIGIKPRILILNRIDMIPESMRQEWLIWFKNQGEKLYLANAKQGKGIKAIKKAAQNAGIAMNQRRCDRGMLPRPVRAVVIGFPNVGKSALINRLLGKNIVESARRPGVTRQLRWVRISEEIELLDSPGIIPWKLENQENAVKLAICEDIGEASYDNQNMAAAFVDLLISLNFESSLKSRYQLDPLGLTGEEYIYYLGQERYNSDKERTAMQILNDFRKGLLGEIPLEIPPL
jgi:ribosome biogenesis GTPase A